MRTLLVLLAVSLAAVSAVPTKSQRIVGGSITTIASYPTITSLLYSWNLSTYWQSCGGTILNTRSILTAAHCTIGDAANRWRVRVGSTFANSGGTVHTLQTIINHPSYGVGARYNNDVAVLRTASVIGYVNNAVQPATIAGSNYNIAHNSVVWAAGWGATSFNGPASETLRHVQIWYVDNTICRQRYGTSAITDGMLCSGDLNNGGRDQCSGDSGGPLYHNGVVVGVCSWGAECALAYYPGVNARVSYYISWIQQNA